MKSSIMTEPKGYLAVASEEHMNEVLLGLEEQGIQTFRVNGSDYSPETLADFVDRAILDGEKGKELAVGAVIDEPWAKEQIDRLVGKVYLAVLPLC